LPEKNFFNDNFELVLSEPTDANTNSTTLLSDETDDRPKENMNQETGTSNQREYEVTLGSLLQFRYSFCCFSRFPFLCFDGATKILGYGNMARKRKWEHVFLVCCMMMTC